MSHRLAPLFLESPTGSQFALTSLAAARAFRPASASSLRGQHLEWTGLCLVDVSVAPSSGSCAFPCGAAGSSLALGTPPSEVFLRLLSPQR